MNRDEAIKARENDIPVNYQGQKVFITWLCMPQDTPHQARIVDNPNWVISSVNEN
jgi:hypothetical protein